MNLIAVPGYLHFPVVRALFQPPSIFFAFLLLSYGHVWRARGSLTYRTMKQAPQDFYCPLDLGLLDPDHSKGRIGWRVEPAYGSSEDDACIMCAKGHDYTHHVQRGHAVSHQHILVQ